MDITRANIYVTGMVQGVWFRASTVDEAKRIGGLTGWAKNLPDGRVEVVCEGGKSDIETLIAWLHRGPELAHVTDVKVTWEDATGEFTSFSVRH